jgi:hypothetical protein
MNITQILANEKAIWSAELKKDGSVTVTRRIGKRFTHSFTKLRAEPGVNLALQASNHYSTTCTTWLTKNEMPAGMTLDSFWTLITDKVIGKKGW